MTPGDFLEAARVPHSLKPQDFGLWSIERVPAPSLDLCNAAGFEPVGWPDYTVLSRMTDATLHQARGEIVMEDSHRELRRHLPIWLAARGSVLISGLGLGCVVRGLLASPHVEHIDVIELDGDIFRIVGAEFVGERRVSLHHGDALQCEIFNQTGAGEIHAPARWDFAWHDLWCEGSYELHSMHIRLLHRFEKRCGRQGAWMLPRALKRHWTRSPLL